ncbi:MAG: EF-hand domain-containing protein [Planctomycetes bacterium]|nr:EF-hand domain-containing protein [Planctomycetota bacterium]
MMAFDKNGDGKLTKGELTDKRLHPLFERADANNDGTVTKEELTALLTKESAALAGGPGAGSPGGFGGPGFGPPPLGQIMPLFVQDQLRLTDAQKKELDALQKDVDAKVEKLLTEEQKRAYKEMKDRGRGQGGPGGFPPAEGVTPRTPPCWAGFVVSTHAHEKSAGAGRVSSAAAFRPRRRIRTLQRMENGDASGCSGVVRRCGFGGDVFQFGSAARRRQGREEGEGRGEG